jgi:hypothetical protein
MGIEDWLGVVLYATQHYEIIIDDSPLPEHREAGVKCYGVRNKRFGVVEAHVGTFPVAVQTAEDLTTMIIAGPNSLDTRIATALEKAGVIPPQGAPPKTRLQS